MKKIETYLREYARRLSDEDLQYLCSRFNQALCTDLFDISNFFSRDRELDRWLATAQSSDEFYEMLDLVESYLDKEAKKLPKAEYV